MLHYSCDVCGRKIEERRFVCRIEVYKSFDQESLASVVSPLDALHDDSDHLEEMAGILNDYDETGDLELERDRSRSFNYDLCSDCQQQYVKDPLGFHKPRRMRISDN